MLLLTDGSEKSPLLGFCLNVISQHDENWPPNEQTLARDFVKWLGFNSFITRDDMKKLCHAKGVTLTFAPLAQDIHGLNCSFQDKKEIVITEHDLAPFSDTHTLFHEFRELLEHVFVELGHSTFDPEHSPEVQAEQFAALCRMEAAAREVPYLMDMAQKIEKKWARYLAYGFFFFCGAAYIFSCIYMRQLEEIGSEAYR